MTDNEIVKALEICTHEHLGCEDGCPFIEECGEDLRALEKAMIGLIKNQKAEIENLNIELQAMRGVANSYKAEVERKDIEIDILIKKKEALRDEVAELREEVENLTIELQAMRGAANSYKAEVKRYEKTVGTLATKKDGTVIATLIGNKTEYIPKKLHEIIKNMAVNRAIKEFAEKLKEYFPSIAKAIDHTAEELIGGDNNG